MSAAGYSRLKLSLEPVPPHFLVCQLENAYIQRGLGQNSEGHQAKYKYRCAICGAKGRLNCREIWEYYEKERIQRLVGFVPLCGLCDQVTHIDLAGVQASEGNLDYEKAVEHFMKVNDCDRSIFERHKEDAFRKWGKRSKDEWTADLGQYKSMVEAADMTDG
jgi:hypothetical protein